jgi:hypothetical protein
MQSFFGKINFVRKFTLDFVKTVKQLQTLFAKMQSLNGMKKGEDILITSRLQYPRHSFCEALTLERIFSFTPFLLTNPWLQYLPKRMMKTMRH